MKDYEKIRTKKNTHTEYKKVTKTIKLPEIIFVVVVVVIVVPFHISPLHWMQPTKREKEKETFVPFIVNQIAFCGLPIGIIRCQMITYM